LSIVVREATPTELDSWDDLVRQCKGYRVYHKKAWLESLAEYTGGKPIYLVAEEGNQVVAYCPGLLVKKLFPKAFGSPLPGWQTETMGPVVVSGYSASPYLVDSILKFLRKSGVLYFEMASSILDSMECGSFHRIPKHTLRIDLQPSLDEILRHMNKGAKSGIKKAQRLGLEVREEHDESFVNEVWEQICEVFTRRGASVPFGRSRVLSLFTHMKAAGNLLALSVWGPTEVCIATGIYLVEPPEAILWMWTHRRQWGYCCPTEIMMWTAMQRVKEMGCTTMDLSGGGGNAKTKFGAYPDNSASRWIWCIHPWFLQLRTVAERAYRLQQRLRGKSARWLTQTIRRHPLA